MDVRWCYDVDFAARWLAAEGLPSPDLSGAWGVQLQIGDRIVGFLLLRWVAAGTAELFVALNRAGRGQWRRRTLDDLWRHAALFGVRRVVTGASECWIGRLLERRGFRPEDGRWVLDMGT